MTASRAQHVIPALVVFMLALVVTWLSFTQEPASSFLFPRIISIAFVTLAIWNFIRAISGMAKVGRGFPKEVLFNFLPGLILMIIYVFWAAKGLGFYVSSTLAFFIAYSLYDPVPLSSVKDWIKRTIVTAIFMAVIYSLFALALQVQTPRGLFI